MGKGKQDSTRASLKSGRKSREGEQPRNRWGGPQGQRELIISYLCSHGILHIHTYMHTLTHTDM